jgi:hypothetical protein
METRERPPSMLRNIDDGLPGRRCWRSDGDPGAPTINAKKYQHWAPWEAVLEIPEHPPLTLKNVDGGPPGRC